jgi:hypothetical protein
MLTFSLIVYIGHAHAIPIEQEDAAGIYTFSVTIAQSAIGQDLFAGRVFVHGGRDVTATLLASVEMFLYKLWKIAMRNARQTILSCFTI